MTHDLMYKDEIQALVRDAYRALGPPGGPAARFYADAELDTLPDGAREWALGVGNPLSLAPVRAGEVVVDLGCGGGVDALLAAAEVGAEGRVVGVDLLGEMVRRGRENAAAAGTGSVSFVQAEMEAVPLEDSCADVVMSNGAINLSGRKSRVLAEAHRVLRPGGRLAVSDLTITDEELPAEILTHPSAWAG